MQEHVASAYRGLEGVNIHGVYVVRKYLYKYQKSPAKLTALREWLWHFAAHVARALAKASTYFQSDVYPCSWDVWWMIIAKGMAVVVKGIAELIYKSQALE